MEANTKENPLGDVKSLMDGMMSNLKNTLGKFEGMMPKELPTKGNVRIGDTFATVTAVKQVNGAITLEFTNQSEADKFYDSIKNS